VTTSPLSSRQCTLITTETQRFIDQTHQHFSLKPRQVSISFDVKGSAWGYFAKKGNNYFIRYNPFLFGRYFEEGIKDTIPHEVAHYAVTRLTPHQRCKPHGNEWQSVMALFGIENPSVTHQSDMTGIPCRRQRRFSYVCRCGKVELSATRHNRLQHHGAKYICRKCGQPLKKT
jgi:SprT protein